ncbi:hypothetical protein ACOBQB_25705 [Streptomyces sp. G5(2025)]|uniref:hypothetical protein n=1 Tax=Streptomyces sp. G5(2025) TaxID=3406628 RepID=UPI003C208308
MSSEGGRLCCRCDKPITMENPGTSMVKISISGGGAVLWVHDKCPKRATFVSRIPR